LVIGAFLILLISCKSNGKADSEKGEEIVILNQETENTLKLTSFGVNEFPDARDGCACYFKEKGKDRGYIYADDFAQTAFIKVGDTFEQMEIYDALTKEGKMFHKCRAEHFG
jgi:hypothetical protein